MKKRIQYIPITTFAAAIAIGGSVSAADSSSIAARTANQQSQSQVNVYGIDTSTNASSSYRSNWSPITASDVLGMNINTTSDEKIGEIDEIFVNSETGEVLALVVSTGGFLNMGGHQTLISPKDLSFNESRDSLEADLSKDQIRTAPRYQKGETAGLDQVRPLTRTGQEWDAQNNRENQANTQSQSQIDYDRSTSMEDENEWTQENNTSQSNRRGVTESSENGEDWSEHSEGLSNIKTQSQNQTAGNHASSTEDKDEFTHQGNKSQSLSQGIAVSDLNDMDVENSDGEDIGEVEEVYLDLDKQKVAGVVVATGGFIGMGERQTLFGLSELSFKGVNEAIVVNYNNDEINGFPEFKSNDPAAFSELEKRTNRLPVNKNRSLTADNARANADRSDYGYSSSDDSGDSVDDSSEVTVFDQDSSSDDNAMSASIRTAISEDDSLSTRANNLDIVTKDEKVVLRGEVDSASEKNSVEKIARNKAGRTNVTSELTVRNRRGHVGQ